MQVEALWRAGKSGPEISRLTGLTVSTIYSIRKQAGLFRHKLQRFTPTDDEIIRRDYHAYVPVAETAARLGRSKGTLRQRILFLGLHRDWQVTMQIKHASAALRAQLHEVPAAEFVALVKRERAQTAQATTAALEEKREREADERERALIEIDAQSMSRQQKMRCMRATGATLEDIAQIFGITRERVRQIIDPLHKEKVRAREGRGPRQPPIRSILRFWRSMTPEHRMEFLQAIEDDVRQLKGGLP